MTDWLLVKIVIQKFLFQKKKCKKIKKETYILCSVEGSVLLEQRLVVLRKSLVLSLGVDCEERCLKKRKFIALFVFALFLGGFATQSFAAETISSGYESHGSTSFYGTYENEGEGSHPGSGGSTGNPGDTGENFGGSSDTVPGYQGKSSIIPQTGDSDETSYYLLGTISLLLGTTLIFKAKKNQSNLRSV